MCLQIDRVRGLSESPSDSLVCVYSCKLIQRISSEAASEEMFLVFQINFSKFQFMCSLFSGMTNSSSQDVEKSVFKNFIETKSNSPIMMLTYIFLLTMSINNKKKTLRWNASDSLCAYHWNPSGEEPKEAFFEKGTWDFLFP